MLEHTIAIITGLLIGQALSTFIIMPALRRKWPHRFIPRVQRIVISPKEKT